MKTELIERYLENKRLIEIANAENDAIKAEIIAEMGNADSIIVGNFRVNNKTITNNRFDSTAFKKEHSDLYAAFQRVTTYTRFEIK